jgi:hypothetical protein
MTLNPSSYARFFFFKHTDFLSYYHSFTFQNYYFRVSILTFSVNVVLLITWFVINPIEYVLTGYGALDRFGRELQVYGKCSSEGQLVYAILLG